MIMLLSPLPKTKEITKLEFFWKVKTPGEINLALEQFSLSVKVLWGFSESLTTEAKPRFGHSHSLSLYFSYLNAP